MIIPKIDFFYFIAALAVGLFFVYVFTPSPEVVYKFPSPFNAGHVMYKDQGDTCYTYKAENVECPIDKALIKPQPFVEDFQQNEQNI